MRSPSREDSSREDAELVARIRIDAKDEEACRRLVAKYWKFLVAWIRPRARDAPEAEDIVQDTLIRALNAIDRLAEPKRFLPWVLRIALNRAADIRRRSPWKQPLSLPSDGEGLANLVAKQDDLGEGLDRRERHRAVLTAVDKLPDRYRVVVLLRYFEGLAGHQIAELLDEPEGTVRNRLFRAHEKLRRLIEEMPPPERASGADRRGSASKADEPSHP